MAGDSLIIKHRQPLLTPKGIPFVYFPGNWESRWVYHAQVLSFNNKHYMLYSGRSTIGKRFGMRHDIGLAYSNDLIHWKRYSKNPIFSPSRNPKFWDSDLVAHQCIIRVKDVFYMFYDGSRKGFWQESVGIARSTDLIHWKKYKENPIFRPGSFWWDKDHVSRCSVFREKNDYYYMFYAGHDGICERIGIARSKNLFSWEKFIPEPVLNLGLKRDWDESHISDPRVIKVDNVYLMTYSGYNHTQKSAIGLAYSKDLIHWKKFANNPIMVGEKGNWDDSEAARADFVKIADKYYLFYSGAEGIFFKIGLAEVDMKRLLSDLKE